MRKLPKNLIKKYGISKKAWAVFKKKKNGGVNMARYRKHSIRHRRGGHSRGSGLMSGLMPIIGGAIYGAARPYLNRAAAPLMAKMPFGQYNNEILMGGAATVAKMFIKNPTARALLTPVQVIEAASAAETAISGATNGGTAASSGVQMFY